MKQNQLNESGRRGTIDICEMFASIQGESTLAGRPCFFIRLSGCNLRCSYCDTKYAYAEGRPLKVCDIVDEFRDSGLGLVEVTGGEPLLQAGTANLLAALLPHGTVLLETNGSRDISGVPEGVVRIMDIKCPGSGENDSMEWRNFAQLRPQDEVKFVICDRADFDWSLELVETHRLDEKCHAVLMSPANGILEPSKLAEWMLGERVSARLNLQLHKVIWGCADRGR